MAEEEHLLYKHTREAAQRFEYFLLGISVALCAFIGQTLTPERLGYNAYTLQVASLVALIGSVVAGFKRVEVMIATSGLNHEIVARQVHRNRLLKGEPMFDERTGVAPNDFQRNYTASEINTVLQNLQKLLAATMARESRWFWWQKNLLATGFVGLLAAKIFQPYL
jgi:hypothetical protein